jgi:hypothetical protein
MKHLFLVDESLSPELAKRLVQLGYSANHTREIEVIRFLHNSNVLVSEKISNALVISTSSRYRIRTI